jgi:hypothetical protein
MLPAVDSELFVLKQNESRPECRPGRPRAGCIGLFTHRIIWNIGDAISYMICAYIYIYIYIYVIYNITAYDIIETKIS